MPKKYLFAAVALCSFALVAPAQEVTMTVADVLNRAATHNADVRSAHSQYASVQQGVAVAQSARLPQVSASLDLNYLGDGTILDRNFSDAMRDRLPHFGNTLNVNLYQPIYQGGAITASIDLARQQAELAAIGIRQTTDGVSLTALTDYFNLLKMRNLRGVYVENIDITERLIAQMTEHYRQGMALRNDITRYQLRRSSLGYDLQSVDNAISVLNNNLVSLLGLPDGTEVSADVDLDTANYALDTEDYWQSLAAAQSTELAAVDKTIGLAHTGLRLERASLLPNVGIVAGDQLTGPITFEIPTINKNYNAWFAGIAVRYNLSSLWTANKKIKQKQFEIEHLADAREATSQALQRKVHEAFVAATQARQMLDTETLNVRLANENYAVVETRFQNDMALLTDMLDASTAKLDAETRLVNARVNLILAYYQLKYISGTLTIQ